MRGISIICGMAVALALGTGPVWAASSEWTNSAGGMFSDDGNWDGGVPADPTDAVWRQANATYVLTFTGNASVGMGTMTNINQNVTFNLGGHTCTFNNGPANWSAAGPYTFNQGNADDNVTLTVSNGTFAIGAGNTYWMFDQRAGNSLGNRSRGWRQRKRKTACCSGLTA